MKPEYSLSADGLRKFASRAVPEEGKNLFDFWGDFADTFGPALIPFLVRPDAIEKVPFAELGIPATKLSALKQLPGEMWVLFCFRNGMRNSIVEGSALRADGFPLILEWRKGQPDSPLLSSAFHALAEQVRKQLDLSGWGLCPAYGRYHDNVGFTDAALFADSGDSRQIASAYGALAAGLLCAVSNRHPSFWPFPTLQWDGEAGRIAGVEGLREKFSVAADSGAAVATVAQEQKREARELLAEMRKEPDGARFRKMSVYAVKHAGNAKRLAEDIAYGASNLRRLVRRIVLGVTIPLAALLLLGGAFAYDSARLVRRYCVDYPQMCGFPKGIHAIPFSEIGGRDAYRFTYRGYDSLNPFQRNRVLREIECLKSGNPEDVLWRQKFSYDGQGRMVETAAFTDSNIPLFLPRIGACRVTTNYKGLSDTPCRYRFYALDGSYVQSEGEETGDGRLVRASGFTANGDPREISGIFCRETLFDHYGNILEDRNIDRHGNLKADIRGFAITRHGYDANGNETSVDFYDADTNRVEGLVDGIVFAAGRRREYDKGRRVKAEWFVDRDEGIAFNHHYMFAGVLHYEYDENGRLTRQLFRDGEGNTATNMEGVCGYAIGYGKEGKNYYLRFLDGNGGLCMGLAVIKGWWAVSRARISGWGIEYDEHGRRTGAIPLDGDGIPTSIDVLYLNKTMVVGKMRTEYLPDGGGRTILFAHRPWGLMGCNRLIINFASNGRVASCEWRDDGDESADNALGFARLVYEYDGAGRLRKRYYLNKDDEHAADKSGLHCTTYDYRKLDGGIQYDVHCLNVDMNPTNSASGYAWKRMCFDEKGRLRSSETFNAQLNPVRWFPDIPCAKVFVEYNAVGDVAAIKMLDEHGRGSLPGGVVQWRIERGDVGSRTLTVSCWDEKGKCLKLQDVSEDWWRKTVGSFARDLYRLDTGGMLYTGGMLSPDMWIVRQHSNGRTLTERD